MTAAIARTPDEQFADLPDYPFEPHFVGIDDKRVGTLRVHFVDEGPPEAAPVLLLHGQPTWSFLYRHIVTDLVDRGHRVVAPDNIGFGRSDKPTPRHVFSLKSHIRWLLALIEQLDLHDTTVVCQDWGGPIGLGALAVQPHRFGRVVATNTVLHTADPALAGRLDWAVHGIEGSSQVVVEESLLDYALGSVRHGVTPSLLVNAATTSDMEPAVLAAYDAPFPDETHRVGLNQMSALIPLTRTDAGSLVNQATTTSLRKWARPFLTAFSDSDPATRGWAELLQEMVPGARRDHPTIVGAGHFVQEDRPKELAQVIDEFIRER